MEITLFILFSFALTAAALASPLKRVHIGQSPAYCDERGEIILLNDLHRTTFRRH